MQTLTITHTTKTYPKLPYQEIKDVILGKKYNLSLVFIGDTRAQKLNQDTRNKSYTPNVLSFPLDDTAGEIYIAPNVAKREAHKFNLSPKGYVGYLFIHALLHLKGLDHGTQMEKLEAKYVSKFGFK